MATTQTPTKTTCITVTSFPKDQLCETNFQCTEKTLPMIKDGWLLIKTQMLSVDPYLRCKMGETTHYGGCFQIGEPACGWGVGQVVTTKDPNFKVGDMIISHQVPWCTYAEVDAKTCMKVRNNMTAEEALGVCGMPAMTAYFGMEMANPAQGETIIVSGGAGAVGSIVGMIAKKKGLKVVGLASTDEKCKVMKEEFGFDHAINYKTTDLETALKKACPNGADIFWDNVGGPICEAACCMLKKSTNGRVISCGSISSYDNMKEKMATADQICKEKNIKVLHVSVFDNMKRWPEAMDKLCELYREGTLKKKTTMYKGIQTMPKAFVDLFAHKNIGKSLIEVCM